MTTTFEIPTLRTDRLVLRAFRAADLDDWATMEAIPEVRRYRGNNPRSREQSWAAMAENLGQWALRGYGVYALERIADGRFIGISGILHRVEWPEPELAYSLAPEAWGHGLAFEAARAARAWAFDHLGFTRLASFIIAENARSIRVAERLGATREGRVTLLGSEVEWWVHRR